MKTLYIIGNGFDIHNGLNTRYQLFAEYLAENNEEVYDLLLKYYNLPDIRDPFLKDEEFALWSRFEAALADLDYISVLNDNTDLMANPGADDFRDRDWHAFQFQMENVIRQLTIDLISDFNEFILTVEYPDPQECRLLELDTDSHFLSFNYTETLQRLYNIPEERICYIHEKANSDICSLILGHGTDPENFVEVDEKEPEGLSEEDYEEWREWKGNQYDFSYESAKQEILGYYAKAFKNTASIIADHEDCFGNYSDVEQVIILGHSLGGVDIKYFEKIKSCVRDIATWHVSYYSDWEKQQHRETLSALGIAEEKIVQMRMIDMVVSDIVPGRTEECVQERQIQQHG